MFVFFRLSLKLQYKLARQTDNVPSCLSIAARVLAGFCRFPSDTCPQVSSLCIYSLIQNVLLYSFQDFNNLGSDQRLFFSFKLVENNRCSFILWISKWKLWSLDKVEIMFQLLRHVFYNKSQIVKYFFGLDSLWFCSFPK